jgi:hypothetical protein
MAVFWLEGVAQDERYYRNLFLKTIKSNSKINKKMPYEFKVHSPYYRIDINNDGEKEGLVYQASSGARKLYIYSGNNDLVRTFELDVSGANPELLKIQLRSLSAKTTLLILHFFEGFSHYTEYAGTVRLYFITVENKNLRTLSMFKGPVVWREFKDRWNNYHKRNYNVLVLDLNSDNYNEVLVKFSNISRVYHYQGKGRWSTL